MEKAPRGTDSQNRANSGAFLHAAVHPLLLPSSPPPPPPPVTVHLAHLVFLTPLTTIVPKHRHRDDDHDDRHLCFAQNVRRSPAAAIASSDHPTHPQKIEQKILLEISHETPSQ